MIVVRAETHPSPSSHKGPHPRVDCDPKPDAAVIHEML